MPSHFIRSVLSVSSACIVVFAIGCIAVFAAGAGTRILPFVPMAQFQVNISCLSGPYAVRYNASFFDQDFGRPRSNTAFPPGPRSSAPGMPVAFIIAAVDLSRADGNPTSFHLKVHWLRRVNAYLFSTGIFPSQLPSIG